MNNDRLQNPQRIESKLPVKRLFSLVGMAVAMLTGTGGPSLVLLAVALLLILLVGLLQRFLARH